jgi:hypothetical protein
VRSGLGLPAVAAVSDSAADTVHVFEGSGASWSPVRVVAGGFRVPGRAPGQLSNPRGLRLTRDGEGLVVADMYNNRVSMFRVEDGSFVRHVATGLSRPYDVEECSGGWLVACNGSIEFVSDGRGRSGDSRASSGRYVGDDGQWFVPVTLALVPSLGMVLRELDLFDGRLQFFSKLDAVAMDSLSPHRVGWMVAVARGIQRRSLLH